MIQALDDFENRICDGMAFFCNRVFPDSIHRECALERNGNGCSCSCVIKADKKCADNMRRNGFRDDAVSLAHNIHRRHRKNIYRAYVGSRNLPRDAVLDRETFRNLEEIAEDTIGASTFELRIECEYGQNIGMRFVMSESGREWSGNPPVSIVLVEKEFPIMVKTGNIDGFFREILNGRTAS